jgi:UDP-N-acetylmuramate dehydrogenase
MIEPQFDQPLAARTSFKIGGRAKELYQPESLGELQEILRALRSSARAPYILGGGANTLFPDGDYSRPVISTGRLRRLERRGETLHAECGVRLNRLLRESIEQGLGGLEGLAGIPGTAGGAVAMNAGGSGWSLGERVKRLGFLPLDGGDLVVLEGRDLPWRYRSWGLEGGVAAWVELELRPDHPERLRQATKDFLRRKARTQPLGLPSAGCVFKNPPEGSAGRWIDALGLKGLRRGGACVSEQHANFIVNAEGRARASDVLSLVDEVRSSVLRAFGVRLETEIVIA